MAAKTLLANPWTVHAEAGSSDARCHTNVYDGTKVMPTVCHPHDALKKICEGDGAIKQPAAGQL